MSLRIAIGGIAHETNTFVPDPTTLDEFTVVRGDAILARRGNGLGHGGMLEAAARHRMQVVPTLLAWANPWGVITREAYEALEAELLEGLRANLPLDVVALDLHGAGITETTDDLEGDLVERVRELVGWDAAVVVTHDLHGNVSQKEADHATAIFCCHHYPHDDLNARGQEAVDFAVRVAAGEVAPVTHVEALPLMMTTTTTYHGVGKEINEFLWSLEERDGVVDVTLQHGFPYCDSALNRTTILCTTDGDRDLARTVAREAGEFVWARRKEFVVTHPLPDEAVAQAAAAAASSSDGPVVINETSDNAGGGAPADGTHLLRALLEVAPQGACFSGIKDAEVVAAATAAGVGARIEAQLGGKTDDLHGDPIAVTAYVKALTDGRIVLEAEMGRGWEIDLGPTALLIINGVEVVVISKGFQTIDRTMLLAHGIDPTHRKLVALKSSNHFRSGFTDLASMIITTDPPGLTTYDLGVFERSRSPSPIFPIDNDATY